ncbi:MAG: D-alanyl-D-alanine carboxypeptidase family protein [Peptococcaceae bacterium]|nr:D-alanyl-D-alanine carboxypeptidase family protein [Peptococcaceae bacterium]
MRKRIVSALVAVTVILLVMPIRGAQAETETRTAAATGAAAGAAGERDAAGERAEAVGATGDLGDLIGLGDLSGLGDQGESAGAVGAVRAGNRPAVFLNGDREDIDAFFVDGFCYVAARPALEYFGTIVFWHGAAQTIALNSREGALGIHRVGEDVIVINGETKRLGAPSVMKDETTYMPITMLAALINADSFSRSEGENVIRIDKRFAPIGNLVSTEDQVLIKEVMAQVAELKNYNPLNFLAYLAYREANPELDIDQVILYVNIGVTKPPYSDIEIIDNPDDPFVVVDKNRQFAKDFAPELTVIDGFRWRREAGEAWVEMKAAARADGISLTLGNTYRGIADQRVNYNRKIQEGRSVENVDATNSRPGHSEHHTGYAADIRPIAGRSDNPIYLWLAANSYKYGFIVSFQAGKEFIHRYAPEPWHIRWFPLEAAAVMYEENLTIQEFENLYANPGRHGFKTNQETARLIADRIK